MTEGKKYGGKREGSGRKKNPLPSAGIYLTAEIKPLFREISCDYQLADEHNRVYIMEQLRAVKRLEPNREKKSVRCTRVVVTKELVSIFREISTAYQRADKHERVRTVEQLEEII